MHTSANASLMAGLGYTGILVSFVARHNPLAVIPVAILFGGFGAAGSLLQRRLDLPDASVLVLQGFAFVLILASDGLSGRLGAWRLRPAKPASSPTVAPPKALAGSPAPSLPVVAASSISGSSMSSATLAGREPA